MIALYAHDLVVLAIAIVSSGFVSTVIHAYMPTLRRSAGRIGDYAAREAVPILLGALPANGLFRAAVAYELRTLASQADMIEASVSTTASAVLMRVAPKFPAASRADVVEVIGDFTRAFAAGLDPSAAPLAAASDPAAPVAPAAP